MRSDASVRCPRKNCSHWLSQLRGSTVPSYVKNSSLAKRGGCWPWEAAAKAPSWRPGAAGMEGGVRDEYASAYPGRPPRAAAPDDAAMGGADGWPGSNVGAVAHDGSGDGDDGNLSSVIGTPASVERKPAVVVAVVAPSA